jgi:MarR family transcriptional regulator, organic hydroperoxide resistance regulator
MLELRAAHRDDRRTHGGDWWRRGRAAKEPKASVAGLHHFDRPRKGLPGGPAVVDSDKDPVEHHRPQFVSALTTLARFLSALNFPEMVAASQQRRIATATPDSDELGAFGAALEELFRAVLRASGRGVPGGSTELTMSQYWVMTALADEPLTVSQVARDARVAVPSATRALRALERRGFVERHRDLDGDGRVVTVALTRSGLDVLDEKRAWVRTAQAQLFDALSPSERRTAAGTLTAISRGIGEL